ncbi:MAG: response regulator transcription factor [Anaerolineae bacterium]|nr:response regulator transcription factor [Anaerolineae bacterium]
MSSQIKIMVVDDHPVVRKGIVAMLETEPDLKVVGECANGAEAIERVQTLKPDVILMDLVMPKVDGIEAIKGIRQIVPNACILVLTSFSAADKVFPSLNAGAMGYLLKDSDPSELIKAIHQVYTGQAYLNPQITRQVLNMFSQPVIGHEAVEEELTDREQEVLKHVARGLSNAEIAQILVVSEATVHSLVSKILAKLHLSSRTQAALYALRRGMVSLDDEQVL